MLHTWESLAKMRAPLFYFSTSQLSVESDSSWRGGCGTKAARIVRNGGWMWRLREWKHSWCICLQIPVPLPGEFHGQKSLAATVRGITKSQTQLSIYHFHFHACMQLFLAPHNFFVFGCSRRSLSRCKHCSTTEKDIRSQPISKCPPLLSRASVLPDLPGANTEALLDHEFQTSSLQSGDFCTD